MVADHVTCSVPVRKHHELRPRRSRTWGTVDLDGPNTNCATLFVL